VLDAGPTLGESHQQWQLAEINKLIWPSPDGIGMIDESLWTQTVDVAVNEEIITAPPDADAYTNDLVEEALAALEDEGVDVNGDDYTAPEVTLNEGGS
jgi:NitT/TauT family transport system substrate-binding protein